jgi:hypothetical protein
MIMIDHFLKWVELVTLSNKSSHNTNQAFLQQVPNIFGACIECLTNKKFRPTWSCSHWPLLDFKGSSPSWWPCIKDGSNIQEKTSEDLPHWEQKGLGPGPTLHHHGLHDIPTRLFVSFCCLLFTFWETSHSTLFYCYSNGLGCGLGLPSHLG